jgi:hypothetical protein
MPEYPLTKGELNELAARGLLASVSFSGASAAFTVWLGIAQGVAFADSVKPEVIAYWAAWQMAAGYAAIVLGLLGLVFTGWNGLRIRDIKKETNHG